MTQKISDTMSGKARKAASTLYQNTNDFTKDVVNSVMIGTGSWAVGAFAIYGFITYTQGAVGDKLEGALIGGALVGATHTVKNLFQEKRESRKGPKPGS